MEGGFTWTKLSDIHLAYGAPPGNNKYAQRIYRQRFLNRICSHARTFMAIHRPLCESGTFHVYRQDVKRRRSVRTLQFEKKILQHFADNPSIGICTVPVAHKLGVVQNFGRVIL